MTDRVSGPAPLASSRSQAAGGVGRFRMCQSEVNRLTMKELVCTHGNRDVSLVLHHRLGESADTGMTTAQCSDFSSSGFHTVAEDGVLFSAPVSRQ